MLLFVKAKLSPSGKITIDINDGEKVIEVDGGVKIDCNKCDVFNFFHDLYNGADLGARSVMSLMKKKSYKKRKYIRSILKKYIDVSMIDKINKINKKKLDWTWAIKDIDFLSKTVKVPIQ